MSTTGDKVFAWVLLIAMPTMMVTVSWAFYKEARKEQRKLTEVEAMVLFIATMVAVVGMTVALILYDHGS